MQLEQEHQLEWFWSGYGFRAMNTTVQTWLYSQIEGDLLQDIHGLFSSFEKRLSRFNPKSELFRLNQCECDTVQVSPILLDALEVALLASEATKGLYDPTILKVLEQAGYDRSFELISPSSLPAKYRRSRPSSPIPPYGNYRSVQINRVRREVYRPPGLKFDLGGMGKGWTVDRAADRLQGIGPFLVNAGGDIFAYQSPPGQRGWEINISHPWKLDRFVAQLFIHHKALATSTIARRRWNHKGEIKHHLIDPRTGQPAQTDAISVTVTADRTVMAEIYAKVALILGVEQGLAYLENLSGVEGLIYTENNEVIYTDGLVDSLEVVEPNGYLPMQ